MRLGSNLGGEPGHGEVLWLVHHHPGRLRVRAERFLDDDEVASRVLRALDGETGILDTTHNPRTGSLLIEYEPDANDVESILALVTDTAGLQSVIDTTATRELRPSPAELVQELGERLDGITRELTGGRASLHDVVSGALTAVSIYSFFRSKEARLPRWDNALYWAYNVFLDGLGRPGEGVDASHLAARHAGSSEDEDE